MWGGVRRCEHVLACARRFGSCGEVWTFVAGWPMLCRCSGVGRGGQVRIGIGRLCLQVWHVPAAMRGKGQVARVATGFRVVFVWG
jgi:hypothetical protein